MVSRVDEDRRQKKASTRYSWTLVTLAWTTVVAPAATRAHGWRITANPAAVHPERSSSLAIHVGGLRGRPRRLRRRSPTKMRSTPIRSLMINAAVDGFDFGTTRSNVLRRSVATGTP